MNTKNAQSLQTSFFLIRIGATIAESHKINHKLKILDPITFQTDNDQLQLLMSGKVEDMNKSKTGIIYHNYMLFKELISGFLDEDPDNSVMMIYDGIDNLICADIRLEKDDDAQEQPNTDDKKGTVKLTSEKSNDKNNRRRGCC